jgi:hypothetical protein
MPDLDRFVPIEVLARHFAVTVSTIRSWVRRGHIPKSTYLKVGNTYRFNISAVVNALTAKPNDEVKQMPVPDKKSDEPVQLELDFGNPDEDA